MVLRFALTALALALCLSTQAVPGHAAALAVTLPSGIKAPQATPVQYRPYRGPIYVPRPAYRPYAYRPYVAPRRYGYRPFVGFTVGAAIVAGAIIANRAYAPRRGYYYDTYDYDGPYYYPPDHRGDPREVCARHFRSFEWETGLYTTYRGEKRMCPYLGI